VTASRLKMGFLMAPLDSILPDRDTTFVFMLEAERRGHEVFHFTTSDMYARNGELFAALRPARVMRDTPHYRLGEPFEADLKSLDAVFFRSDPPVTMDYLYQTYLLDLITGDVFVTNNPSGVRDANEKLFALNFPELMPEHLVTGEMGRIKRFIKDVGGGVVVKPLDRMGGEGVFVIENGDMNTNALLEVSTGHGTRKVIAQRYVPEVRRGDKRILLLDGEFLGATARIPQDDEHRANIHAGADTIRCELTGRDREIIGKVGPKLREMGLHFVGLDVLGDWLTEVNVTSPTGIQEINRLYGVNLEAEVIDFVERKAG